MAGGKVVEGHVEDPPPEQGDRAALKPDENPALKGNGSLKIICGSCGGMLAHNIWEDQIFDIGLICADCGTFNDTPSAVGGAVKGDVVYAPVGTYRLGDTLRMRRGVPMVGEPFPGAGPPQEGGVVGKIGE